MAAQKPADILFLVTAAFSFAGAAFFPVLVLGIFWKRANGPGAIAGMLTGLGLTGYYMVAAHPWLRSAFKLAGPPELWWGIQPLSAGLFGVPAAFAACVLVSLLTPGARGRAAGPGRTPSHAADALKTAARLAAVSLQGILAGFPCRTHDC